MALFYSVRQLEEMEMESALPLWRQILLASAEESGVSPEQSLAKMNAALDAMIAADADYDPRSAASSSAASSRARSVWANATPACTASSPRRRPAPAA